jgi:hypothetical protein
MSESRPMRNALPLWSLTEKLACRPDRSLVTSTLPRSLRANGRVGLVFVSGETGSNIRFWRTDK